MNIRPPLETAYFPGEFLTLDDYADEQAYHIALQRLGAACLNDWGLLQGFQVVAAPEGGYTVDAGLAVDGQGRFVVLSEATRVGSPTTQTSDSQGSVLIASYSETVAPASPTGVAYVQEGCQLAWEPAGSAGDPSLHLVLAHCGPGGAPLSPGSRRYAGAAAGSVQLWGPDGAGASITGWSANGQSGLWINAPTFLVTAADAPAVFTATTGPVGLGTLTPSAVLDVLGTDVSVSGPGRLTSFNTLARGSDPTLPKRVQVGTLLLTTDRQGNPRQAEILRILDDGSLLTDEPLNCQDAPYAYLQPLVASVSRSSDGAPLMVVDATGRTGFGLDTPQARLHLGDGVDFNVAPGNRIAFAGDGTISTVNAEAASKVLFQAGQEQVVFQQESGGFALRAGHAGATTDPVGVVLTPDGRLGVGTRNPEAMLDVAGWIQSEKSGFVYPDGSVQATAEVSVPIGTVLDWWRGSTTIEVPDRYLICNGSQVNDSESPFNGLFLPNLDGEFVIGAPLSQAGQKSGSNEHTHTFTTPSHTHPIPHTHPQITNQQTGRANDDAGMAGVPDNNSQDGHRHQFNATAGAPSGTSTDVNSDAGTQATTQASTLAPPYVGLLKIIRIK